MRPRSVPRAIVLIVALAALASALAVDSLPSRADTAGPSCGETVVKGDKDITYRILFAKNGAVQRYVLIDNPTKSMEDANDMRLALEKQYGLEGNAPPLHIVSFKQGSGGMMIPDKAVDSCGRTLSFQ